MLRRVTFLMLLLPFFLHAETITLCSYVSPPYQIMEGSKLGGKAVKEMTCILGKMDTTHVTHAKPWLRCEKDAMAGKFDGIYTVTPKPELTGSMVFSDPMALEKWYWFYKGELTMGSNLKVGAVRGSNQQTWLEQQGITVTNKLNTASQMFKLLENGRIDAFVADEAVSEEAGFPTGVSKKFIRYLPLGVYFTKTFADGHGDFVDKFNSHIHECQSDKVGLSDSDKSALNKLVVKIKAAMNAEVISAIIAQNEKHAAITNDEILVLDKKWRNKESAEGKQFREKVLSNSLSGYLKNMKKESVGIYSEIFVMDNKGLNVGQSDVTSDYWQGDEGKFKKSYGVGADGMFIDDIEFDQSSKTFQSQVNLTVTDTAGVAIGAITVGVDVEKALASE